MPECSALDPGDRRTEREERTIADERGWIGRARTRARRSRWNFFGTIVRVDTAEPMVSLTFDDGPDPEFTPRFLDVLDHRGGKATFFMIGRAAESHPELVRQVADRGHAVANHTWSHASLPGLPGRERRREIRRCAAALAPFGERLLRPPKGHQTVASRVDVLLCRHRPVAWSAAFDDWRGHDADWLASRLEAGLAPGRILLLHDGLWDPEDAEAADRGPLVDAVDRVLARCGDEYEFVTLPELFERGDPVRQSWFNTPGDGPS